MKEATAEEMGVGVFEFTDDYSVFDYGKMPDVIPNKGEALCRMAAYNFQQLKKLGIKIDLALNFTASDKVLLERLTGRRTCRKCAAIYHIKNIPSKIPGICDKCSGELYQRDDDTESAIRVRWEEYDKQTMPLIDYYEKQGLLVEVDASDEVDKIMPRVLEIIEKRMK